MEIKNKNVRKYIDKYLHNQVIRGNYKNLLEAYGDFYNVRDKVRLEYIVTQAIQERIEEQDENAMLLGKYVYYPATGKYCYFG